MGDVLLAWGSDDVRAAEEPLLAARVPLMDRAAFALATVVAARLRERRGRVGGATVVLLVGGGNNGGDALWAGVRLLGRGAEVTALLVSERAHPEGSVAFREAGGRIRSLDGSSDGSSVRDAAALAAQADVVLDGMLGIGARGGLRGTGAALVTALQEAFAAVERPPLVVAVDVPSGIGVDDGSVPGPVLTADLTVTFGCAKPGLLLPPAAALAGRVDVVDIGLRNAGTPAVVRLGADDLAALWPVPGEAAHKYTRGVLGVVAGTPRYPGAAVLVSSAAVLAGVGMVRYVGEVGDAVLAARPEVVVGTGRVQAWAVGPGIDPDDEVAAARVRDALGAAAADDLPVVADAGALGLLPDRLTPLTVLTPHAGELATLLGARGERVQRADVEREPLRWAVRAQQLTGATVLLKGAVTVVAGPHGARYAQAEAPAWLATAGAGDVLTGLLGALLAGRSDDVRADPTLVAALAAAAASVHGRAARAANPGGPVAALAVAQALPGVLAELVAPRETAAADA
ncbi:NAD(P)H-hydrate epimerase [Cellulomonas sp. 73-145]|uniref:NAD(P)H-hydrate epimerase n=1 Tax=Cellulomonas sp. 73-145 TaxID=1895739 RepID=UPI000AA1ABB5|nr:NAD(P)H-hydrate epimerase [Cellulomonas sp. 73-145]